jgi:hypothetical protein
MSLQKPTTSAATDPRHEARGSRVGYRQKRSSRQRRCSCYEIDLTGLTERTKEPGKTDQDRPRAISRTGPIGRGPQRRLLHRRQGSHEAESAACRRREPRQRSGPSQMTIGFCDTTSLAALGASKSLRRALLVAEAKQDCRDPSDSRRAPPGWASRWRGPTRASCAPAPPGEGSLTSDLGGSSAGSGASPADRNSMTCPLIR